MFKQRIIKKKKKKKKRAIFAVMNATLSSSDTKSWKSQARKGGEPTR